jgi:hypothetical protein
MVTRTFSGFAACRAGGVGLALALAAVALPSQAATQGAFGATSSGSVTITASVPARARISGLTDVSFLSQDPAVAATSTQNVCVWSNTATRTYTITASGSGTANAFTIANGALTTPYSVQWSGSTSQTTGTALVAGTASSSFASAATQQACTSGPTASASLIVGISTADLEAMQALTTYSGTLTLLVTPQ